MNPITHSGQWVELRRVGSQTLVFASLDGTTDNVSVVRSEQEPCGHDKIGLQSPTVTVPDAGGAKGRLPGMTQEEGSDPNPFHPGDVGPNMAPPCFFVAAMAVCIAMVPLSADDAPQQIDETKDKR
jgi:hypothetical protein